MISVKRKVRYGVMREIDESPLIDQHFHYSLIRIHLQPTFGHLWIMRDILDDQIRGPQFD